MTDLSKEPISDLVNTVIQRQAELLDQAGNLTDEAFRLADILGIRFCVDGIPVRRNERDEIEAMAILRNSGPNTGKWTAIGGGVARVKSETGKLLPESMAEAMVRHFKTDIGYDIDLATDTMHPQLLIEQMRAVDGVVRPGFEINPTTRHCVAARYLVTITNPEFEPVYGSTKYGGQEAAARTWFSTATMPADETFGYMHDRTYREMLALAEPLLAA